MSGSKAILYLIFALIFFIFHLTGALASDLPYILNALITFTVVSVSILILDKWYSRVSYLQVINNLGFHKTSLKKIFPGILISFLLLLMYPLYRLIFGFDMFFNNSAFLNLAGLFLTAGLAEEMFFRGFLFRHLRERMSFRKSSIESMVLFAAAHLMMFTYMEWSISLFSTVLAVAISVPMAYLFESSDNTIWSPALVHMTVRTIGLVITTTDENFMKLTLLWITGCMVIPFWVIIFMKDFRFIWKQS